MSKLNNVYLVKNQSSTLTVSDGNSLYISDNLGWQSSTRATSGTNYIYNIEQNNFYQFILKDQYNRFINFGIMQIRATGKNCLGGRYSPANNYTNWGEASLQISLSSGTTYTWVVGYCAKGTRVNAWLNANNCTLYYRKVNL